MGFKDLHSLTKRQAESNRIRLKYPDRCPVIVERGGSGAELKALDKCKYLVPADLQLSQFAYVIRKRLSLQPEQAIFLFVGGSVPAASSLISQLYREHADVDGFLYITYNGENAFGA